MSESDVVAKVLEEMRALRVAVEGQRSLPMVLTMKRAAVELSVSLSQVKVLIRSGALLTVPIGKRDMVPASEIRRLATPPDAPARKKAPNGLQDPEALKSRR